MKIGILNEKYLRVGLWAFAENFLGEVKVIYIDIMYQNTHIRLLVGG